MSSNKYKADISRAVSWLSLSETIIVCVIICEITAIVAAIVLDQLWLSVLIPVMSVAIFFACFKDKLLYQLLFFFIPLSAAVQLGSGLSTDLPSEPILWLLTICTLIFLLRHSISRHIMTSISCILFIHLGWIAFTTIFAFDPWVSVKYLFAKTWYILPFYVLPYYMITDKYDIRTIIKFFIAGSLVGAFYYFSQHYQLGLSYLSRSNAGQPIWRNHVNYATTIVITLPMYWYLYKSSYSIHRWVYVLLALSAVVCMHYAYARIVYLCIVTALIYIVIIRLKLTRISILMTFIIITSSIFWLQHNNKYLDLSPEYTKTVMQEDFEHKITATIKGRDISSMERVYRWVAGAFMIVDHPLTGVGPSNFYATYKPYGIYSFETYVSHNPERSGIHNYYFMVLVEQGWIGFFIFLLLIIAALCKIESRYHRTQDSKEKHLILCIGSILMMILTINTVNDMVEVIKIGGIFFLFLSIISHPLIDSNHLKNTNPL